MAGPIQDNKNMARLLERGRMLIIAHKLADRADILLRYIVRSIKGERARNGGVK